MKKIIGPILGMLILFVFMNRGFLYAEWEDMQNLKVAVLDFEISESRMGNINTITEVFQGELVNQNAFIVVERDLLKQIIDEQRLELSGITETEAASQVGQLLGAQKMVTGTIAELGNKIMITIKAIDVATGAIEISDQVTIYNVDQIIEVLPIMAERLAAKAKGEELEPLIFERVEDLSQGYIEGRPDIDEETMQIIKNLNVMINEEVFLDQNGLNEMKAESSILDYEIRMKLYDEYGINVFAGFMLNIVPSLGSWMMGDIGGAILIDLGMIAGGVGMALDSPVMLYVGLGVMGITYVYNFYRAVYYGKRWNASLSESLNIYSYNNYSNYPSGVAVNDWMYNDLNENGGNIIHLNLLAFRF